MPAPAASLVPPAAATTAATLIPPAASTAALTATTSTPPTYNSDDKHDGNAHGTNRIDRICQGHPG